MFKSDKELNRYLKDGGVIKPVGVLPSVYTWVQLKAGNLELLNSYPAHVILSHEYWERADTAGDLAIIEFFKRG